MDRDFDQSVGESDRDIYDKEVESAGGKATGTQTKSNGGRSGAMALSATGGVMSAMAQYQSGRTNQKLARFNANYDRVQAEQAIQAGGFAALRRQGVQDLLAGHTIAAQAGGGTVVGAGTNRLVTADQQNASSMDQMMIDLNAKREAYADEVRARGSELQGDMARRAGEAGAIGTLLNTAGNEWLLSDPSYDPGRFGRGLAVGKASG